MLMSWRHEPSGSIIPVRELAKPIVIIVYYSVMFQINQVKLFDILIVPVIILCLRVIFNIAVFILLLNIFKCVS